MDFNPNQKPPEPNPNTSYGGSTNPYDPYPPVPPSGPNPAGPNAPYPNPYAPPPPTPPPYPNPYAPPPPFATPPYPNQYTSPPTTPPNFYPNMPPAVMPPGSFGGPAPQPPRRASLARIMPLLLLAAVVILAGIGLALFIPYQQAQTQKANATATAQTHATGVARAATGTVLANNATATALVNSATATVQANASATAAVIAANPNPYPPNSGALVLYDPLTANNQGNNWSDSVDQSGVGCIFKDSAYHISSAKGYIHSCTINSYTNFAFEARLTILNGDCGSLVFRNGNSAYYAFSVCHDGVYYLDAYTKSQTNLINSSSPAIKTGFNQSNVIAVVVRGTSINLYANGQHLSSAVDSTSSSGSIGFGADAPNNATEVAFNDMKLWTF